MNETIDIRELREEKKDITTKIIVVGLIIIGSLALIIFASVYNQIVTQRITQVLVKVEYDGEWQGAYGDQTGISSWSSHGSKTITLNRPSQAGSVWIISANAQKLDGSQKTLIIMITKTDGTILKEGITTSPYGIAQIVYSIQD